MDSITKRIDEIMKVINNKSGTKEGLALGRELDKLLDSISLTKTDEDSNPFFTIDEIDNMYGMK